MEGLLLRLSFRRFPRTLSCVSTCQSAREAVSPSVCPRSEPVGLSGLGLLATSKGGDNAHEGHIWILGLI